MLSRWYASVADHHPVAYSGRCCACVVAAVTVTVTVTVAVAAATATATAVAATATARSWWRPVLASLRERAGSLLQPIEHDARPRCAVARPRRCASKGCQTMIGTSVPVLEHSW